MFVRIVLSILSPMIMILIALVNQDLPKLIINVRQTALLVQHQMLKENVFALEERFFSEINVWHLLHALNDPHLIHLLLLVFVITEARILLMVLAKVVEVIAFGVKTNVFAQQDSLALLVNAEHVIQELHTMELIVLADLAILETEIFALHAIRVVANVTDLKLINAQLVLTSLLFFRMDSAQRTLPAILASSSTMDNAQNV